MSNYGVSTRYLHFMTRRFYRFIQMGGILVYSFHFFRVSLRLREHFFKNQRILVGPFLHKTVDYSYGFLSGCFPPLVRNHPK